METAPGRSWIIEISEYEIMCFYHGWQGLPQAPRPSEPQKEKARAFWGSPGFKVYGRYGFYIL
jgi:hypothetical protein